MLALYLAPRVGASVMGLWSLTAVLLGVLIVYATTQPQRVRGMVGSAVVAMGLAGVALWLDQVFYCPDCCGLGGWFLCWWL